MFSSNLTKEMVYFVQVSVGRSFKISTMDSTSLIPWITFATKGTLTLLQPCPVVTLITRIEAC